MAVGTASISPEFHCTGWSRATLVHPNRGRPRQHRHSGPDRDPKALPKLFEDWETESMHAHGWTRPPKFRPPAHLRLVSRGDG
ncbi:hypothetical protein [Streptomyces clavifer]|uniref:hypothetical protein n=1 Tax=Streptomyces clavifer TaxID=68188 RepID=UPI0036D024E7